MKKDKKKRGEKMSNKKFGLVAGILIVVGVIGVIFAIVMSASNKAINLEEQIKESKSAIKVQEKRRVDLIYNLVDTVKNYDKHEKDTLTELAKVRSSAQGDIEKATTAINAVTEAYPELKSQENYKTLMNELSTTENLIAEYRNNYNLQVKQYNKHVRKFPNSIFLNSTGYEKMDVDYLNYDAPEDAPTNLFDDK